MSRFREGRTRPPKTGEGARYQIADHQWLQAFLTAIVADYGGGSEVQACISVGAKFNAKISRATLNRLRRGTAEPNKPPGVVSHQVAEALERIALARGVHADFVQAILSPVRSHVQQGYAEWCHERGWRFAKRLADSWKRVGDSITRTAFSPLKAIARQKRLKAIEHALRRHDGALDQFEKWLIKRRVSGHRGAVAMTRIIEPLAENAESAFAE